MTGSSLHTNGTTEVPPDREDGVDLDDLIDELEQVYHTPPYDISKRGYLELCLVVAEQLDGDKGPLSTPALYSNLSDHTRSEVDPDRGGIGITNVADSYSTLTVERRMYKPTLYSVGYATAHAYDTLQHFAEDNPAEVAEAVDLLDETGEIELLEQLFSEADTTATTTQHQQETTRRTGTDNDDGRKTADGRAIVPNLSAAGTSVESVEIRRQQRFDCDLGRTTKRTGCGNWRTGRGSLWNQRGEPGARLRITLLSGDNVEELKNRTPKGRCPRCSMPTELYDDIVEWRPVLAESESLAAILQLNLLSFQRDEDYRFNGDCTNIPIYHERIFDSFGLVPQVAWNAGINSGMLLELYRQIVDPELDWTDWHAEKGKARVIKSHGIPTDIVRKAKELMLSPEDYDDWTELISGKKVNRRNWTATLREERLEMIEEQEPVIEPPTSTKRIQGYLNGLPQTTFSHGGHGILRGGAVDNAIWTVVGMIDEEERRDQELRKLYWMRKFPQPLYWFCDRFPRLKADYNNQAMNLPSPVLRSMYTERDYELDLAKAHLACMVPLAEQEGIDASLLRDYLEASMDGEDIWEGIADSFYQGYDWDDTAARKTAKKVYALVYGSGLDNLFHEMSGVYGDQTGDYRNFDAFRSIVDHPLVKDIIRIRRQLEPIITDRGGLEDAQGRFVPLSAWDETKDRNKRWRGVMAYVNASYEQEIMAAPFEEARKEQERDARPRFRIWLYQADGFTMRVRSKASHSRQVERLQNAVEEKAEELGVPTELEVDYTI